MEVAGELGTTRATVGKWRRRFIRVGCRRCAVVLCVDEKPQIQALERS